MNMKQLSTEPYKGTRDFYPADMRLQNYIFSTMRSVTEKYGYQEYTASIIEETDLYRAKTGEEIVGEQTYSFTDRGDRDITLRPEMTPTVARMVANKRRKLVFPVRWYSIPNCFRYERPQRGRLREFWQLNVDILGVDNIFADSEVIDMAYRIMTTFGADPNSFIIKINNRKLMNELYADILRLDDDQSHRLSKLIDKKNKMTSDEFEKESQAIITTSYDVFKKFIQINTVESLSNMFPNSPAAREVIEVMNILKTNGITNTAFDPTLMRGFDYYTGVVFEVFDTHPTNNRAMFGGGRYDNLVDLFGVESVPAFGFGMGDVTMQDYLETYNLVPNLTSTRDLTLCTLDESSVVFAMNLAAELRKQSIAVAVDYSNRKIGNKIKSAEKDGSQYVICIGEEELKNGTYVIKNLAESSEEKVMGIEGVIERIKTK
jgi:histidyl-tRNA synthetase